LFRMMLQSYECNGLAGSNYGVSIIFNDLI
jgi:hypothetical protein